jgi:hypothetical protein
MSNATRQYFRPPELARRWGVSDDKVIRFIKSGELEAIDLSTERNKRPRYAVSREAVESFELRRQVSPAPKPQRRKRQSQDVVEFF